LLPEGVMALDQYIKLLIDVSENDLNHVEKSNKNFGQSSIFENADHFAGELG
jgi:hypothetical protein